MTDNPYRLDMFTEVTDCHFSNDWLIIYIDLKFPPSTAITMDVDVSFPDQAGGTPGFEMITALVPNLTFKPAPYRATAAVLANSEIRTQAGSSLTGFAVRSLADDPTRGNRNAALYIKLDQKMPRSPFRVRVHYITSNPLSGSGIGELFTVATMRNVKPAIIRTSTDPAFGTLVGAQTAVTESDDHERTFDFTVSPSTLAVSPPVG